MILEVKCINFFQMIYLTAWAFWHLTVGISLAYYSDKTCTWFPSIHNNPIKDVQGDVYYGNIKLVSCGFTLNLIISISFYIKSIISNILIP